MGLDKAIMSKRKITAQSYPRIQDEQHPYYGYLDDSALMPHNYKIPLNELEKLIISAIQYANMKSSREILSIPANATDDQIEVILVKQGKELFKYFKKYVSDPAAVAYQMLGKHYRTVGSELFRIRTIQKERMNSGWRYQYLAYECASRTKRFKSVSDVGTKGDFNAVINLTDSSKLSLSLYVSVKNRSNTVGGQDFPNAIRALEDIARNDKNRIGPYCCVFGIAMEKGLRSVRYEQATGVPHSPNAEIWLADFFWPFFTNHSYEEIMKAVLNVLIRLSEKDNLPTEVIVPDKLLDAFGEECHAKGLLDVDGYFNDPFKLVEFFCQK
jgi:hypothetical protein